VHVSEADPKDKMITRRGSTNARLGDLTETIIPLFMSNIQRCKINGKTPSLSPQKSAIPKFRVSAEQGGERFGNLR
jgi:hypothetical protein